MRRSLFLLFICFQAFSPGSCRDAADVQHFSQERRRFARFKSELRRQDGLLQDVNIPYRICRKWEMVKLKKKKRIN